MPTPPLKLTDAAFARRHVVSLTKLSANQVTGQIVKGCLPTVDLDIPNGTISFVNPDGSVTTEKLPRTDKDRPSANLYTFRDLIAVAAFGELWLGDDSYPGLASETAGELITLNREAIIKACSEEGAGAPDIWIAFIWTPPHELPGGGIRNWYHLAGPLEDVVVGISNRALVAGCPPSSMALVNVSSAIRQVRARAKEAGIPLPPPAHI